MRSAVAIEKLTLGMAQHDRVHVVGAGGPKHVVDLSLAHVP
jgi:hypothetical protein